ncbi:MAG: Methylase involved in ubiquinone/menaquinone biosynthesis [Candidatus Doudnabacteria bacterium]|nr:Methylase involved in ubiquinone/menaquinone biosynthesis [Candidatus Doudnabacteria bacterium]
MELSTQYNNFAKKFSEVHDTGENSNNLNRKLFYSYLDFVKPGMKLLDVACGDGLDLLYYKELGAAVYGIDASKEMVALAQSRMPDADIRTGLFESLPFEENFFDVVLSKYAIMTSSDLKPVFKEVHRVLKPGGVMMYLVTHPFRQYFEKKDNTADYFEQQIVDSNILNNTILVKEPSHTMNEYLNDFLFKNFDVQLFDEQWDPSAEQIDGKKYPGFFILKAVKRQGI